jgi:alcohol dehydrogenase (cytochrome c)
MRTLLSLPILMLLVFDAKPVFSDVTGGPTQQELNRAAENTVDWLHVGHDYAGQRYISLDQINSHNANQLRPVCAYQAAVSESFYTNPLVYQGIMYLTTRFETLAIDARTCRLRWKRDHYPNGKPRVQANRGIAIKDGKVLRGTVDGRLVSMDSSTGEVLWERNIIGSAVKEEIVDMAPIVVDDIVIIGVAGSESGIRGWIGGFRLNDGTPVWRFNVIPNAGEQGSETWGNTAVLEKGGGGIWTPVVLDEEHGQLFIGTADPAPTLDGSTRPGDNLYTDSLVVLDVHTGKLLWYRQLFPHDLYDRGVTAGPLFTAKVRGQPRVLVAAAGKDGLLRVLDRETHEPLFETPVSKQLNEHVPPNETGVHVCPGITGGVLWNGPAYSPRTNLLYVPSVDWCTTYTIGGDPKQWFGHYFAGSVRWDPVETARGALTAVDASTGHVAWRYESNAPMVAAVTATGSDVLFTGEISGDFLTLNAKNGQVLYRFNTGGSVAGGVISYAIDKKQYVAAMSGGMTWFWQRPGGSATVFVFALP